MAENIETSLKIMNSMGWMKDHQRLMDLETTRTEARHLLNEKMHRLAQIREKLAEQSKCLWTRNHNRGVLFNAEFDRVWDNAVCAGHEKYLSHVDDHVADVAVLKLEEANLTAEISRLEEILKESAHARDELTRIDTGELFKVLVEMINAISTIQTENNAMKSDILELPQENKQLSQLCCDMSTKNVELTKEQAELKGMNKILAHMIEEAKTNLIHVDSRCAERDIMIHGDLVSSKEFNRFCDMSLISSSKQIKVGEAGEVVCCGDRATDRHCTSRFPLPLTCKSQWKVKVAGSDKYTTLLGVIGTPRDLPEDTKLYEACYGWTHEACSAGKVEWLPGRTGWLDGDVGEFTYDPIQQTLQIYRLRTGITHSLTVPLQQAYIHFYSYDGKISAGFSPSNVFCSKCIIADAVKWAVAYSTVSDSSLMVWSGSDLKLTYHADHYAPGYYLSGPLPVTECAWEVRIVSEAEGVRFGVVNSVVDGQLGDNVGTDQFYGWSSTIEYSPGKSTRRQQLFAPNHTLRFYHSPSSKRLYVWNRDMSETAFISVPEKIRICCIISSLGTIQFSAG
jgi:hypothetical protein